MNAKKKISYYFEVKKSFDLALKGPEGFGITKIVN